MEDNHGWTEDIESAETFDDQSEVTAADEQSAEGGDSNRKIKNADEAEKSRIRAIKRRRARRLEATTFLDPETDKTFARARVKSSLRGAVGLVAAALAHGGTNNTLTYVDPGPHPRGRKDDPGWENCPEINVERILTRVASGHESVNLTEDFVREAAAEIGEMLDRRMNATHARVHRALNSIAWMLLVDQYGLEQAQELKDKIEWWLLRDAGASEDVADDPTEAAP